MSRIRRRLPSAFVAIPALLACAVAVLVTALAGPVAGLLAGALAGLASLAIEGQVNALAAIAAKITHGDRYAIVPRQPRGPLADLAKAVRRTQRWA
jgi:hypothetical protein